MNEEIKYHNFPRKKSKLKEVLMLLRDSSSSNYDESGTTIILCLECEEWTHVKFNINSCLLDLLGELTVESIDAEDGNIIAWIETDEFNWFNKNKETTENEKKENKTEKPGET